jgi:arylsulfatase A-like enzyme
MPLRLILWLLFCGWLIPVCVLCADQADAGKQDKRPSVLWIMLDDGRADALGCYGKPWAQTPNIDAIAADGVRFQTAIVQNPVCTPSRTCIKTGLYAHQTGVMAMGRPTKTPGGYRRNVWSGSQQHNLLKAWSQRGIPVKNIGKMHVFKKDWHDLGDFGPILGHVAQPTALFKPEWKGKLISSVHTKTHHWMIGGQLDVPVSEFRQSRIGDRAVAELKKLTARDDPFFLRVSFHAPHVACYICPSHFIDPSTIDLPLPTAEEFANKPKFERENLHTYSGAADLSRSEIDLARGTYYGMVRLVDDQVGRIMQVLEEAGRLENTIVVINSDQGFQLGEHGLWKKRDFYDTNVCVPLIISAAGQLPAGTVVGPPVEMVDFLPTLIELCGMTPPAHISGKSLIPLMLGKVGSWREACFSEHDHSEDIYDELRQGGGRRVMVRTKDWKLVFFMDERLEDQDPALYHLMTDPYEQQNLAHDPQYEDVVAKLISMARKWDGQS